MGGWWWVVVMKLSAAPQLQAPWVCVNQGACACDWKEGEGGCTWGGCEVGGDV